METIEDLGTKALATRPQTRMPFVHPAMRYRVLRHQMRMHVCLAHSAAPVIATGKHDAIALKPIVDLASIGRFRETLGKVDPQMLGGSGVER